MLSPPVGPVDCLCVFLFAIFSIDLSIHTFSHVPFRRCIEVHVVHARLLPGLRAMIAI